MQLQARSWGAVTAAMAMVSLLSAADHGPVFGLATPTNPQGGWSFDLGVNGRSGTASNLEAELSYGLTQNIKLAVSGPVVFQPDVYAITPRLQARTGACDLGDPAGCQTASRFSRVILWCSATIYMAGCFTAYLLGPLLVRFDQ